MILGILIAALLVARFCIPGEAQSEPMPACMTCGQRFLDARGVDWHRQACHPPLDPLTYDDGSIARWNR